jgi:sugar phosphate isomerase/epimerase
MKTDLSHIISRCFVNIPFVDFARYEDFVSRHRINPEIGLDGDILYTATRENFEARARFLEKRGLQCTLHAPFHDMLPGARDRVILAATRKKFKRCFDLIKIFKPRSVVCHLGYLDCVHGSDMDRWLATSVETWHQLLGVAAEQEVPVMFENTYERGPAVHRMLLEALNSPFAGFCLDTGHILAFAQAPLRDWLEILGGRLRQLHLHDNDGGRDEHLPLGKGVFDFAGLFSFLAAREIRPIVTLEPRSEKDLIESLIALDRFIIFDHK